QINGRAHSERYGDAESDNGRYDRTVDEWKRTELTADRIPGLGKKEIEAEGLSREPRVNPQLKYEEDSNRQYRGRKDQSDKMGSPSPIAEPLNKHACPPGGGHGHCL